MLNKNKQNKDDEKKFIQCLYDEANKKIEEIYAEHKSNKDELLKEIGFVLLLYKISDTIMKLNDIEKLKLNKKFLAIIKKSFNKQVKLTSKVITEILEETAKNTFDFYGKKYTQKDIEDIVNQKYKGKVYIKRIKSNENKIANQLNNDIQDFLDGKIDVNTIHKDIEKTYKQNKDNVVTLAETELNRTEGLAFLLFAKSIGVTKFVRNEVLDSRTCDECASLNGKIFDYKNLIENPHPRCRGFNQIYSEKAKD